MVAESEESSRLLTAFLSVVLFTKNACLSLQTCCMGWHETLRQGLKGAHEEGG